MSIDYSIAEISQRTKLSDHTLRYYEQIGLIGPIFRTKAGYRRYQQKDIEAIEFVKHLRATGMSVADMTRMGELRAQGLHTQATRMQILFNHRNAVRLQINELEANLIAIEDKLASHGWIINTKES